LGGLSGGGVFVGGNFRVAEELVRVNLTVSVIEFSSVVVLMARCLLVLGGPTGGLVGKDRLFSWLGSRVRAFLWLDC
jgi:hypothetical protein